MQVSVGAVSDVGRVRAGNEDAYLAELPVLVVADGMGGHAAGEVASRLVVQALSDLGQRDQLVAEDVVRQLGEANDRILASARRDPDQHGMGTTVSGVALVHDGGQQQWAVFNVGDSRVYELTEQGLRQVTVDHSLVQELVDAGVLSSSEAARHPNRNVVTRSMGRDPMVPVDVLLVPMRAGQRFVVCSDGLSDELDPGAIESVLRSAGDAQQAAVALTAAALDAGGHDNVTVLVVDVH